jgi:hypothetical protein
LREIIFNIFHYITDIKFRVKIFVIKLAELPAGEEKGFRRSGIHPLLAFPPYYSSS